MCKGVPIHWKQAKNTEKDLVSSGIWAWDISVRIATTFKLSYMGWAVTNVLLLMNKSPVILTTSYMQYDSYCAAPTILIPDYEDDNSYILLLRSVFLLSSFSEYSGNLVQRSLLSELLVVLTESPCSGSYEATALHFLWNKRLVVKITIFDADSKYKNSYSWSLNICCICTCKHGQGQYNKNASILGHRTTVISLKLHAVIGLIRNDLTTS